MLVCDISWLQSSINATKYINIYKYIYIYI